MPDILSIPAEVIIMHPVGLFMFVWIWILFAFILVIFIKTPAWTFLTAKFIILNPSEDRTLRIQKGKKHGSLAHVKKTGYYVIDPDDVYIEPKSKKPVTVAFGNFAIPINIHMAKLVETLHGWGLKNWRDLANYILALRTWHEKEKKKNPDKKMEDPTITFMGTSVPVSIVSDYYNRNERSDFIESEIQRRTASVVMSKLNQSGNILKWILVVGIVAFILLIGFSAVQTMAPSGSGGGISIEQLQEIINAPSKVVSEGTSIQ